MECLPVGAREGLEHGRQGPRRGWTHGDDRLSSLQSGTRAGIQRPDMVAALGIRLQPYMTAVVMLGVGMVALAGAFFAPISIVHPAMGSEIITVAFVVVVIGGLGSFWGVVIAALLVGVVRGITIHFEPAAGEASIYVLMFLVLLVRPRGLLGERIEKFE